MELINQVLILTVEGMAVTFLICAIIIGLSSLVRIIIERLQRRVQPVPSQISDNEEPDSTTEDKSRVAVFAALSAMMQDRPFIIRSVTRHKERAGAWERSALEELARTQGGDE